MIATAERFSTACGGLALPSEPELSSSAHSVHRARAGVVAGDQDAPSRLQSLRSSMAPMASRLGSSKKPTVRSVAMTDTTNRLPLSPAAQAVMMAATNGNINVVNDPVYRQCIAAALRAAADQVVPPDPCGDDCCITQCEHIRTDLLAIAAA